MGLLPTYLNDIFVTKSLKYNVRTENNIPNFNTVRYGKHSIADILDHTYGLNFRMKLEISHLNYV